MLAPSPVVSGVLGGRLRIHGHIAAYSLLELI